MLFIVCHLCSEWSSQRAQQKWFSFFFGNSTGKFYQSDRKVEIENETLKIGLTPQVLVPLLVALTISSFPYLTITLSGSLSLSLSPSLPPSLYLSNTHALSRALSLLQATIIISISLSKKPLRWATVVQYYSCHGPYLPVQSPFRYTPNLS